MKVLNFGSLNYDYVYKVDHIMQPGETQASKGMQTFCGGKGFNQTIALARSGVNVFHAGCIGADGQMFLDVCRQNGVDTTFLMQLDGKSGHTIIQVDKNAQNCIMLYGGTNRQQTRDSVDKVLGHFAEGDILLLQNEINELDYIIDRAYEKRMQIFLNPSPYDRGLDICDMKKISVFLLNEIEGNMMTGKEQPEEILEAMLEQYPDAKIVLTLGSEGAVYCDKIQRCAQPVFPVKAVDTTAAGDTFTGYFISGMIKELPMENILKRASMAAAIAVTREGAAPSIPGYEEVDRALD